MFIVFSILKPADWKCRLLCRGFILATVLVHLPTPAQMAREIQTDAPDLSVAAARSSIIGYIYGVTPGLALLVVFGLTRPFRQTIYRKFVPRRWQKTSQGHGEQAGQPPHAGAQGAARAALTPDLWTTGGKLGTSRPSTPRKDWVQPINVGRATVSDEDLYELSVGAGGQEGPGKAVVPAPETRPGSSDSTASLNPLLNAPPSSDSSPKFVYIPSFDGSAYKK